MGTIYLDEFDIVRFDQTPGGEEARTATLNRGVMHLTHMVEHLVTTAERAKVLLGKGNPDEVVADFAQLAAIREDILAKAARRRGGQRALT